MLFFSLIEIFSVVGGIVSFLEGMIFYIKDEKIDEGESIVLLFSDVNNKVIIIILINFFVCDIFFIVGIWLRKF